MLTSVPRNSLVPPLGRMIVVLALTSILWLSSLLSHFQLLWNDNDKMVTIL